MKHPSLTMVVPTLGRRPEWLADCLHSITTQAGPTCRVIVVAPSSARLAICDRPSIQVARHDSEGLSSAVNYGWGLDPDSDYVSWLGDDDLLAPDSLAATSSFLGLHPYCSMVYGRVRYIDEQGASLWLSRPTRLAAPYLHLGKNFLSQQGSVIRRSALVDVGWLDPRLTNSMDQDLFTRLRRVGRRAYLCCELGAFRLHQASISSTKGTTDESEMVREKQWSDRQLDLYRSWRVVGRRVDWALDAAMRRLPTPPVPLHQGRPYTQPSCPAR